MDENHQDKSESKLTATENTSQLSSFSPEDEKEAQKELDRLRKRLRENESGAVNVTRKLNRKRTGFEDKTLWDWLNLLGVLAIPLVVVGATIAFGLLQANLAQQQHLQDQSIALDQQRQATLVKYQDDMRDLLLNKGLLTSKPGDEIRVIALTETLSAMRQLDAKRISFLIQFLQNAHLNGVVPPTGVNYNIVNFSGADLSAIDFANVDLSYADLYGAYLYNATMSGADFYNANLNDANLDGADLDGANLFKADLGGTNLPDADLDGAFLSDANLVGANLVGANLSSANLYEADLNGANLYEADLNEAYLDNAQNLTQQQLDKAYTCKGALLPKGLTCHHNL